MRRARVPASAVRAAPAMRASAMAAVLRQRRSDKKHRQARGRAKNENKSCGGFHSGLPDNFPEELCDLLRGGWTHCRLPSTAGPLAACRFHLGALRSPGILLVRYDHTGQIPSFSIL